MRCPVFWDRTWSHRVLVSPRFETSGSILLDIRPPEDETIMFSETLGGQYSIMKHHIPEEIPNIGTLEKSNINKANEKWVS
jgi:hypothetical protein